MYKKLDYNLVMFDWLAPIFRTTTILQYLTALLKPIKTANVAFQNFVELSISDVKHTGQVIMVEHFLNTRTLASDYVYLDEGFNLSDELLICSEDNDFGNNIIYLDFADKEAQLGTSPFVYYDDPGNSYDFSVYISVNDYNIENVRYSIISSLERYKLPGTSYKIFKYKK